MEWLGDELDVAELRSDPVLIEQARRHHQDGNLPERGIAGAEVVLDAVHGGGHLIPQAQTQMPTRLGPMTGDLDGPAEMWSFFVRQPARATH